ncbi:MAG: hypothetical protein NT030_08060 [Candidatus Saganbacteria bacterium]|nr:hypothetical protein [Candidatus Saganbacteria bacterium]
MIGGIIFVVLVVGLVAFFAFIKPKFIDKKPDVCVNCGAPTPAIPATPDEPACPNCGAPVEPKPPPVIKLSLVPTNSMNVIEGSFSTKTISIQAVEDITGNDCADCVIRSWFKNGTLVPAINMTKYQNDGWKAGDTIVYQIDVVGAVKSISVRIL